MPFSSVLPVMCMFYGFYLEKKVYYTTCLFVIIINNGIILGLLKLKLGARGKIASKIITYKYEYKT